ncbi:UNKNOWN [Stylonychia lemnae]|uniref:CCDC81 HU domain-containing protein n=1 Tax=Stylonychia lemnae TaxID=5949 RepID=A0A078BBY7_STYLE|nr:UNKNOWN [Stylonychia lemnae]|eukprot:CDW91113.1 UNKNOWN [Stylonychia lemnae]
MKQSFLGEKHLIKLCVLSPKYTKDFIAQLHSQHSIAVQNPENKNELNKETMKQFYKVWSGLTKYLKSQCDKSRCVDFPLVGRFLKKNINDREITIFVPHIDFVESGRFKFLENDSNVSPLNKQVQIEVSRQSKEIKLDLKIGFLHSFPNGDLQFENYDQPENYENERFEPRQLQQGQNDNPYETYSILQSNASKSIAGYSHQFSVRTPQTYGEKSVYSKTHSQMNRTVNDWSKKRWSNVVKKNQDDNKTEIYSKFSKGRLNNSDYDFVAEQMKKNEFISNETFEAFMAKKMKTRPGKRIKFPQTTQAENQKELLDQYLTQIRDKERKKLEDRRQKIDEEKQNLEQLTQQIIIENQKMNITSQTKKIKFKEGIEEGKHEKNQVKLMEREAKFNESPTYFFPFTHGDHIEKQREHIRQELRDDLQNAIRSSSNVVKGQSGDYTERAYQNRDSTQRSNTPSLLNATHRTYFHPQGDKKQEELRQRFVQEQPNFIKPHDIHRSRVADETKVQDALVNARQRFEQELMLKKKFNQDNIAEVQRQVEESNSYYHQMEQQKKQQMLETRKILEQQMKEEQYRKYLQKNEIKIPTNTTYGPQETEEISQLLRDKKLVEQENMRKILMEQMKGKSDNVHMQKQIERELEKINLQKISKLLEDQQSVEKSKDKSNKNQYKEVWLDQASMGHRLKAEEKVL